MEPVEPFHCTAETGHVVIHSVPGVGYLQSDPLGAHGGYAAILLDSAMGLAVQSTLPAGTGYTTLEFKISFIRGMSKDTGVIRTEGKVLKFRPPHGNGRSTHHRFRRQAAGACHHHLPGVRASKGSLTGTPVLRRAKEGQHCTSRLCAPCGLCG